MRKKQTPWKRKIGTLSITILTSWKKINDLISENPKFNLNLPLNPFYDCFSFPSTLSVYFCTNIILLFRKWGRIKLMAQDWWQKSHLFFIKLFEAKSSCRVTVGQFSENNTSTQAMAVVDIWEPNATMASTFFCSFDALAFEHTSVTFIVSSKLKKKRNIFDSITELSLLFHLLWT